MSTWCGTCERNLDDDDDWWSYGSLFQLKTSNGKVAYPVLSAGDWPPNTNICNHCYEKIQTDELITKADAMAENNGVVYAILKNAHRSKAEEKDFLFIRKQTYVTKFPKASKHINSMAKFYENIEVKVQEL